jgi:hypothetical protein
MRSIDELRKVVQELRKFGKFPPSHPRPDDQVRYLVAYVHKLEKELAERRKQDRSFFA